MTPESRTAAPAEPEPVGASGLREAWRDFLPVRALELRELITELPGRAWERDPELLVALASTYRTASGLNHYAALSLLDGAEPLITEDRLRAHAALLRSACLRGLGRLEEARAVAEQTITVLAGAEVPLGERISLQARARIAEGIAQALLGDLASGEASIRHGLGLAGFEQTTSWLVEGFGWLALIAAHSGAVEGAQPHLEAAHRLGDDSGLMDDLAGLPSRIAEALLLTDHGRYQQARELLVPLAGPCAGTEYEILRLHTLVIAWGGDRGAFEQFGLLQQAGVMLQAWSAPSLYAVNHEAVRAVALLQSGALSGARDAIDSLHAVLAAVGDPHHAFCASRLEGRLALHLGQYERVLEATRPCRTLSDDHAPRTRAYVDVLRAVAHLRLGDSATAAAGIDRVLASAARTGWRRPLSLLPGALLAQLLDNAATRAHDAEVGALIDSLRQQLPAAAERLEPLSERERLILGHLAAGLSRQQISGLLHVSPNTIKSQARSLYRKLGVSGRHEAVERAARYGMQP